MSNAGLINSSIGRKILMALTGLFLCIFLIEHLIGNSLLLLGDGGASFNDFSATMSHNLFIRLVEIFLFLAILVHIIDAIVLTVRNRQARGGIAYSVNNVSVNSTWFSRNMPVTGLIILLFFILHLKDFFYEYRIEGLENETLYDEVVEAFQTGWYVAFNCVAFILLGFHLNHGFQSAFQTLGLGHKEYFRVIKGIGIAFTVIVTIGFVVIPLAIFFEICN